MTVETLRMVTDAGALEPAEALTLFQPILAQVVVAHGAGRIHAGLCPEAIGLASQSGAIAAHLLDSGAPGPAAGAYAAPEVGSRAADARADQYALAAILYELLTGDPPARRARRAESLRAARADPVRLARELPGVPAHAAIALLRALEPDPEDRYPSVREFGTALFGSSALPSRSAREQAAVMASWVGAGVRWSAYAAGAALLAMGAAYALGSHGVSMAALAEDRVERRSEAYARALEQSLPTLLPAGQASGRQFGSLVQAFEAGAQAPPAERLPATVALHQALRDALARSATGMVEVELEALDTARDVTERAFDDWTTAAQSPTAALAVRLDLPLAMPPER